MNLNVGMTTTRISNFTRINPLDFHGSKVDEDPHEFIDDAYKIIEIMGVSMVEKVELATYQLKGVAKVWFNQWKEKRVIAA
ncbi:hypothetical protein MTR67_040113 [Solanum verrucosum]|uniref:Gag-pol polyprotein n=1 Tax=Solanum verrucosum TaxID=315347 RepID=A0AAF0ZR37_SOLVR|nr:hypothetical protein MTR67_040113 [Solanum verrucosum]